MKNWLKKGKRCALLTAMLVMLFSLCALASEDDNSLSSLGILTEGATVEPEFTPSTWECTVTVPAGTKELELDPVTSSSSATVSDISGTTLDEDGTGYVTISVTAGNGDVFTYGVHVESDGTAAPAETETEAQTEAQTEPQTEAQTEPQTEDPKYVKVDRNTVQEAENTISTLKDEITRYRDRINLFTMIMYGLIGLSVILLFIVINLLLKKKDLKAELNDYRSYGYSTSPKAVKAAKKQQKKQAKKEAAGYMPQDDQDQMYPQEPMGYMPQNGQGYAPQQGSQSFAQAPVNAPVQQNAQTAPIQEPAKASKPKKKNKKMPQYSEQTVPQQPVQNTPAAPQEQPVNAPQPKNGGSASKKDDVEIDMIDL